MDTQATLVVRNAKVLTMNEAQPRAEAIAVRGNRILAVGTNEEIDGYCGQQTRVIDAAGATALPGFNEAHMHLFGGSASLTNLSLFGVQGMDALRDAIMGYAAAHPAQKLLIGRSADYAIISETERVTRHHLDRAIPDRPFIMTAPDFHTAWANTEALRQAGILGGCDVALGSEIVIGDDGLASGELREFDAIRPVMALSETGGREALGIVTGGEPGFVTPEDRAADIAVLKRGLNYCASLGITSIQNMDGNLYQLELLNEIESSDGLPVRARMPFHMKNFMPLSDLVDKAVAWRERFASDRLRCDFVKMFMDGVVESGTAVLVDDYSNRPGWKGEPLFTAHHFAQVCIEADRLNLPVAVHAIGDGAVRMVLDGYEAARNENGGRDSRNRVEHAEIVQREDIPRFAELGVIASMQPTHPPGSAGLPLEPYLSCVGEARWPLAFAWRDLANAGAAIVFATDWPVSPLAPMNSIHSAMTRKVWDTGLPDQRLSLMESLAAYTRTSAWVEFMEDRKGILKDGYLADIVVLSADIENTSYEHLSTVYPIATVCDGRLTHEAS